MVELAGGRRNMMDKLRQAVSRGNYQWALKLSVYLVDIESSEQEEVKDLRSKCLQTLAYREVSAPGTGQDRVPEAGTCASAQTETGKQAFTFNTRPRVNVETVRFTPNSLHQAQSSLG